MSYANLTLAQLMEAEQRTVLEIASLGNTLANRKRRLTCLRTLITKREREPISMIVIDEAPEILSPSPANSPRASRRSPSVSSSSSKSNLEDGTSSDEAAVRVDNQVQMQPVSSISPVADVAPVVAVPAVATVNRPLVRQKSKSSKKRSEWTPPNWCPQCYHTKVRDERKLKYKIQGHVHKMTPLYLDKFAGHHGI